MQKLENEVIRRLANIVSANTVYIAELESRLAQALTTVDALEKEMNASGDNKQQSANSTAGKPTSDK